MPPAIPRATYRLQLLAAFGFDEAAAVVPYLRDLGISHVYASPFLRARAGSTHGYDIIDHNMLNPEFGGEAAFERLSATLSAADMGLILDFVPNHMGVGHADNAWWLDVLEWGPRSPFAAMFDIDWTTLPYRRQGGLLLPILGKPYGEALESGEIELKFDAGTGSFSFWYFDHRLPLRPERYSEVIKTAVNFSQADGAAASALLALAGRYRDLRSPSRAEAPKFKAALVAISGAADVLEQGLSAFRADPADPSRVSALHHLLERQHYRVAQWRVAISEINYRRFFDINDLAGIRVEDPRVFHLVHRKVLDLVARGALHGLRLDHIDGLHDPFQYCARLRRAVAEAAPARKGLYTVVEKILAPGEAMPPFPGVAGTTGYDVLNLISRVLADNAGLPVLEQAWQTNAAPGRNFEQFVEEAKSRIIETSMASEFTVLARLLARIAAGHWPSRDFTVDRLSAALELFILNFPVYRTYIAGRPPTPGDRAVIAGAIAKARAGWYGADIAIFDFLQDALTLDLVAPGRAGYSSSRVKRFAAKTQQFTGPMTAKAVEDTAFYRYHRLLALNEVGNDPSLPALGIQEFHAAMLARAERHPHAMTATATHDTKRGEDARARLLALSEVAQDWSDAVQRWRALNARLVPQAKYRIPSRAHEYMLYQALLGAWQAPIDGTFVERVKAYAIKAAREGKQNTSWVNANGDYENGLTSFVEALLISDEAAAFRQEFDAFARRLALLGALNGLSQLVLKLAIPGVPDIYQGTELWDLALVDPDYRRPVAFAERAAMLDADADIATLARSWQDGAIKQAVLHRLLRLRADAPALFSEGTYEPIAVAGPGRDHVVAFARRRGGDAVIVVAGRHFAALTDGGERWPSGPDFNASIDLSGYRAACDTLTRRTVETEPEADLAAVLSQLPVAVMRARAG